MWFLASALYAWTPAPTSEPVAPPALTTLASRAPPTDWVFLLDTSADMLPVSSLVLPEIASLVEKLPDDDRVEIIIFHARTNVALPALTLTPSNRAAASQRIRTLEISAAVDRDLGAGLDTLVREVTRPDAAAFTSAFLISNFCHAPVVTSPWSSGGSGCSPIRGQASIGETYATARGDRVVTTYLFPLSPAGGTADAGGVDAAIRELGGEVIVAPTAKWFADLRERLPERRLTPMLAADASKLALQARLVRAPSTHAPEATLELSAPVAVAGLRLQRMQVTGGELLGEVPELRPRGEITVRVRRPKSPISLFPRSDTVNVTVKLAADGLLVPEDEVRALRIEPSHPNLSVALTVPFTREYGLPLPGAIGVLVATFVIGGVGAVLIRGRLSPRRLGGSFQYRYQSGPRLGIELGHLAEAALVARPDGSLELGTTEEAAIILRIRRPVWTAHAEVEVRRDDVELNQKRLPRGRHPVIAGACSFTFGDFRLAWE